MAFAHPLFDAVHQIGVLQQHDVHFQNASQFRRGIVGQVCLQLQQFGHDLLARLR